MSGKRKNPEAAIQRELVKWLHINHPYVRIKYNKNEDAGNIVRAMNNKLMGRAEAGYPDLTLDIDKKGWTWILELELKTQTGKLNPAQKTWWQNFIPTANRKGAIAYGYQQALEAVQNWLKDF